DLVSPSPADYGEGASFLRQFREHGMRSFVVLVTAGLALAALPALGQTPAKSPYSVQFDAQRDVLFHGGVGEQGAFFTVNFKLIRHAAAGNEPGKAYKVG